MRAASSASGLAKEPGPSATTTSPRQVQVGAPQSSPAARRWAAMRPSAEDRQTTSVGKPTVLESPRSAPPSSLASVVTPAPECAPRHAHFGLWPGANPEISGSADGGVGDGVVAHAPAP